MLLPVTALAQSYAEVDNLGLAAKDSWANWGIYLAVVVASVVGLLMAPRSWGMGAAVIVLALGAGGILLAMT